MITSFNLFEAKQTGILYHFTNLISYYYINNCNCLTSNRYVSDFEELYKSYNLNNKDIYKKYISFTRNKNFFKDEFLKTSLDKIINVRLTIDGDKLSENNKIYKINFFPDNFRRKESEEVIITDEEFHNIGKYIINVEIPDLNSFKYEMFEYDYDFEHFKEINIEHIVNLADLYDGFEYFINTDRDKNDNKNHDFIEKLYNYILDNINYNKIIKVYDNKF